MATTNPLKTITEIDPGKFLLISILIVFGTLLNAQGTWEKIAVPTDVTLNSVFFTDSLYGWIAGDSGTIMNTSDGGQTWNRQVTGTTNNIVSVFFLDRNKGWAASQNYATIPYGTIMMKTLNGGNEWTSFPYPENDIFMNCILFRDSLNGWMGGNPHALVRTIDGGITWSQAAVDTSVLAFFPVLNIHFYDEKYGYACGGRFDIAGVLWRTNDGGNLWHAIDPSEAPADEVHELHLFDSVNVMGAGGDPDFGYGVGMIRTSNGGINWTYHELNMQGYASDLDFRNEKEAWAPLGSRGKLIYSMDAGDTWTEIPTPDSTIITNMIFPDSLHGFGIGRNGAFIRYKPKITGIDDKVLNHLHSSFTLAQNSPNPFSSSTKIKFSIHGDGEIRPATLQIRVFSSSGVLVKTMDTGKCIPGEYEITMDGTDLPQGIYYYFLFLSDQERLVSCAGPGKMILLR